MVHRASLDMGAPIFGCSGVEAEPMYSSYILMILVAGIVWRNFSILSPKLVLEYAEDILSDSRLKNCAKCKGDDASLCVLSVLRFGLKRDFWGKKCI